MKDLIKDIENGKRDGELFWIFDVRYSDYSQRPHRNILPTQVVVRSNDAVPDRINYSESHFVPLKNGTAMQKKLIKLYDNTGYRSHPGTPVQVFRTEEECRAAFKQRVAVIKSELDSWLATQTLIHTSIVNTLTEAL